MNRNEDVNKIIKKYKINTFGNKRNIEKLTNMIDDNEKIFYIAPTNIQITYMSMSKRKEKYPGVWALTNQRIIFLYNIGIESKLEEVSLDKIENIDYSTNLLTGGYIQVYTLVKNYKILCTYKSKVVEEIYKKFKELLNNTSI